MSTSIRWQPVLQLGPEIIAQRGCGEVRLTVIALARQRVLCVDSSGLERQLNRETGIEIRAGHDLKIVAAPEAIQRAVMDCEFETAVDQPELPLARVAGLLTRAGLSVRAANQRTVVIAGDAYGRRVSRLLKTQDAPQVARDLVELLDTALARAYTAGLATRGNER